MSQNRIAVLIVNWNSGDHLLSSIRSLSSQTHPPHRILIVDNASTDDSLDKLSKIQNEVEILRLDENTGFAAANNLGVKHLEDSPWIALLNPDAFPHEDWLLMLSNAIQEHPQYSFFGCCLIDHNRPDRLDGTGDAYHVNGLAWRKNHGEPIDNNPDEPTEIFSPCAAAALYKREAFLEIGGFDEKFFCYFEDVDLSFRLQLRGHRCLYLPQAKVKHVGWGTTETKSDFSLYHGHRNLIWTYVKNMPGRKIWTHLPQHILQNLLTLIWFTIQGKGSTLLKAKKDAILGLPHYIKMRKNTQKMRITPDARILSLMETGWLKPYLQKIKHDSSKRPEDHSS